MISACLECARSGICFELQLCLWNANIREPIRLPKSLHIIRVRIENATFAISSAATLSFASHFPLCYWNISIFSFPVPPFSTPANNAEHGAHFARVMTYCRPLTPLTKLHPCCCIIVAPVAQLGTLIV